MSADLDRRQEIIEGALILARQFGLSSINARGVAKQCNMSVGTLYNYFPSCDELTIAVVEKLFENTFKDDFCYPRAQECYISYCRRLFSALQENMGQQGTYWIAQLQGLSPGARKIGAERMDELFAHIINGLMHVLKNDSSAHADTSGPLNAEHLTKFTVAIMFNALRADQNCETAFALLESYLYGMSE